MTLKIFLSEIGKDGERGVREREREREGQRVCGGREMHREKRGGESMRNSVFWSELCHAACRGKSFSGRRCLYATISRKTGTEIQANILDSSQTFQLVNA